MHHPDGTAGHRPCPAHVFDHPGGDQSTQLERDLGGALRDAERQVANARHYVQQRVDDLNEQQQRHVRDAQTCLDGRLYLASAKHLQTAAQHQAAALELLRVLDLL